jgi:hypothetical protein
MGVIFRSKANAEFILAIQWYWDHHLFCSKPWHPLFDVNEEILSSMPIWIKLPNLPLQFWSDAGLKAIGEVLDSFITVDKRYKFSKHQLVAHILVDINPRHGLFESMDIVLGDKTYTQQLDYLNMSFCFSRCHRVGHLHVDCGLVFRRSRNFGDREGSLNHLDKLALILNKKFPLKVVSDNLGEFLGIDSEEVKDASLPKVQDVKPMCTFE